MAAYTVHEPPSNAGTRFERAERVVFVKDGFSWGAFLFGPLYFLARAEWLSLAAYVIAAAVASAVVALFGAGDDWAGWVLTLLNVIAGFEASEMKRWSLARAGWREIGAVNANRCEQAERRFFDAWMQEIPAETPRSTSDEPPHPGAPWYADAKERVSAAVHQLSSNLRERLVPKT